MSSAARAVSYGFLLLLMLGFVSLQAQPSDPQLGRWVLNLAKSNFNPGPPPKSQTRTFELTDKGVKFTADGIDANGKPAHAEYLANFDGKDYPIMGSASADSIALKRRDPYTLEVTQKKGGKVVITGARTISRDGRVATVTNAGTDGQGRSINDVLVFDKQ